MDSLATLLLVIMGIKIMQINIKNWTKHKFLSEIEAVHNNIDVILVIETGACNNNKVNLSGHKSISKSIFEYSGTAILVKKKKKKLSFLATDANDNNTAAIKIHNSRVTNCSHFLYCSKKQLYANCRIKQTFKSQLAANNSRRL